MFDRFCLSFFAKYVSQDVGSFTLTPNRARRASNIPSTSSACPQSVAVYFSACCKCNRKPVAFSCWLPPHLHSCRMKEFTSSIPSKNGASNRSRVSVDVPAASPAAIAPFAHFSQVNISVVSLLSPCHGCCKSIGSYCHNQCYTIQLSDL